MAFGAGVHVEDTVGCLEPEIVELELRTAIGDEVVDRVDLRVSLSGTEHWQLELEVLDSRGPLWSRVVAVEPEDCPYLTAFLTQSVERGLTELPGWDFAFRPPPSELGLVLSGTLPWAMQIGLGADLWSPVRGRLHWNVQTDLIYGLIDQFELDPEQDAAALEPAPAEPVPTGTAQLTAFTFATGPGVDFPVGRGAVRLATRIGAGASLAVGGGTAETYRQILPRALVTTDLGWAAPTAFRVALRVEVPLIRFGYTDRPPDPNDPYGPLFAEPPLRIGVVMGIAGPLRRTDVGGSERR